MKRRRILAAAALVIALLAGGTWAFRERIVLSYLGSQIEKRTLAEQAAFIEPYIHVYAPETGAAPFPTIVQFHGCAGYKPAFMDGWAKIATQAGFLVLAVDSGAPRGFDRDAMLAKVCSGKELIGQERAADIAAALSIVRARSDIDPDRLIVAGWSHGAWSLMDYLALSGAHRAPPALKGEAAPVDPAGVILFYPYCGAGSWSRLLRWRTKAEAIAFIAGEDSIVDADACRGMLDAIKRKGTSLELVYYPQADHAFDDAGNLGGDYAYLYSEEADRDSRVRYAAFLERIKAGR